MMKKFWKKRETAIRLIVECYNTFYGRLEIIETPKSFILYLYNGGWSDNEEYESKFRKQISPDIDKHPISIYSFQKHIIKHYNKDLYEYFERNKTSKRKGYSYKVKFD